MQSLPAKAPEKVSDASPMPRQGWFHRGVDLLFGYDYFISYAWGDGRVYAAELARQLRELGFVCFLDSTSYVKGDDWRSAGRRAIRQTTQLILVGTPGALASEPVLREVEAFGKSGRRIVPISFGNSLFPPERSAPLFQHVNPDILAIRELPEQVTVGPAEETLRELGTSFRMLRQNQKRLRWFAAASFVFAALALIALVLFLVAEQRRKVAHARALAAQARNELERQQDLALLLAAQADETHATDETRSSLGYALGLAPTEFFLHHPDAPIDTVVALPGELIAGCDWRGQVTLWNLATRRATATKILSESELFALAADPTGQTLAAGGRDGIVHLLALHDGLRETGKHELAGAVRALAWIDDRRLVVSADRAILGVLDTKSGSWHPLEGVHTSPPTALALDRAAGTMLSAGWDHKLVFWTLSESGPAQPEEVPSRATVMSLALSPDGRWLAVGTHDHGLELWQRDQRKAVTTIGDGAEDGRVLAVTFSPDSQIIAWAGDNGVVNRYDFKKEKGAAHPVHRDAVLGLAITADGQRIISAGRDGKLWIGLRDSVSPLAEQVAAFSSETWITAVELLDDTLLAMGNGAGELRVLDVTTALPSPPIAAHTGTVHGLVYLAQAGILVSLGEDAMVRAWHLRGKTLEPAGDGVQVTVPARLLRWRGSELALVSADGAIHIGRPGLGELRLLLRLPAEQKLLRNGPILAAMDPERSILAAVANDHELWAFDLETGHGARLTQTDSGFTALAFDPSGQLFVAQLTGLEVWDPVTATRAFSLPTGVRSIADFEPLPGTGLLVSTDSSNELTFWGLQERGQIGPWTPLPGVDTAAILADARGQYLYTVVRSYGSETRTNDYQVHRWTLAVERWRALARRMANRDFTETELERFAP